MANTNLITLFSNIANAIRGKDGSTGTIAASDFADRIASIPAGATLKSGTFTGNGTRTVTITLEDNADDIIMFDVYKTSGASASAVFSCHFDANNKRAVVSSSGSTAAYNTTNLTVTRSGKTITLAFNVAFNFITNASYEYCYVI